MNEEQRHFLSLVTPPARVSIKEAGWLLGFTEHDVSILVSAGMLKPLGHPPASGSKYFARSEIEVQRSDVRWLAKASDIIVNYWKKKNAGRVSNQTKSAQVKL